MKAVTVLMVAFLFTGCSEDYYRDYLEDLLGVELPHGTCNVEHFTGSDLALTSHYTLPSDSVSRFASATGMTAVPPADWDAPLFTAELSPPWQSIPEQGPFLYGAGAAGWNSWDMQMGENTGDLWVTVYYTDASGDFALEVSRDTNPSGRILRR